ncbi:MAG: hypothetical protein RLZZ244_831 [Verrucomicrobiota bacterium]
MGGCCGSRGDAILRCRRAVFGPVSADAGAECWAGLEEVSLVEVRTGGAPNQATRVRVGWDGVDLRLLWRVEDDWVWANLTERGAPLFTEEVVEFFVDPVGDGAAYFEVELNPNNAVMEAAMRRIRSGYRKDFRWGCEGLRTAVQRREGGWDAEMAIPVASLVGDSLPESGARWRVNFTRIDRPRGLPRELSAWSPTGLAQFHVPTCFGTVIFAD